MEPYGHPLVPEGQKELGLEDDISAHCWTILDTGGKRQGPLERDGRSLCQKAH